MCIEKIERGRRKGWEFLETLGFPFPTHGSVCEFGITHNVLANGCFQKNERNIHWELKR
jgi:hypothetical protein